MQLLSDMRSEALNARQPPENTVRSSISEGHKIIAHGCHHARCFPDQRGPSESVACTSSESYHPDLFPAAKVKSEMAARSITWQAKIHVGVDSILLPSVIALQDASWT